MANREALALELASGLARWLDFRTPEGVAVRAIGGVIAVQGGKGTSQLQRETDLAAIIGDRDPQTGAENAALAVLSGVQDVISILTSEPWPQDARGSMALPNATAGRAGIRFGYYGEDRAIIEGSLRLWGPSPV
jgi:hypothetical protein